MPPAGARKPSESSHQICPPPFPNPDPKAGSRLPKGYALMSTASYDAVKSEEKTLRMTTDRRVNELILLDGLQRAIA